MSLKPNRNHAFILISVVIPVVLLVAGIANAQSDGNAISAVGREGVKINEEVFATFHFSPGKIHVKSGDTIIFKDLTTDPHTLSIVTASDIQSLQTVGQIFGCGAPGTPCFSILVAHFPNGPPSGPFSTCTPPNCIQVVNAGPAGLDEPGDSLLVLPGGTAVTVTVSAPSGTTLHFICAFHPWMQGQIIVG